MHDFDYFGLADGQSPPRCKHQDVAAKFVAFEGWHTNNGFLGCAGEY
jgi:hypothetical protein